MLLALRSLYEPQNSRWTYRVTSTYERGTPSFTPRPESGQTESGSDGWTPRPEGGESP